jgi:hypothetical protein
VCGLYLLVEQRAAKALDLEFHQVQVQVSHAVSPETLARRGLRPPNLDVHASRSQQAKAVKTANNGDTGNFMMWRVQHQERSAAYGGSGPA